MSRPQTYDKTKWHEGADAALAGLFLGWAVRRDLASDEISPDDERAVKSGRCSGPGLVAIYDGTFTRDMLDTEGRRFADAYYAAGLFATDAKALLARSGARVTATVTKSIERKLDQRFSAWRKESGRLAGTRTAAKRATKTATNAGTKSATKPAPATEARLAKLRSRARKPHAVDPEHLIAFAQLGDRAAAPILRELAEKHAWRRSGKGHMLIGTWADVVATYLEGGAKKLVSCVRDGESAGSFALGLLEEIHTVDATKAVLAIAALAEKRADKTLLREAVDALGSQLRARPRAATQIPDATARAARALAHRLLARKITTNEVVAAYSILEAVGDHRSLALIESRPPLREPYTDCERPVIAALKSRLRNKK